MQYTILSQKAQPGWAKDFCGTAKKIYHLSENYVILSSDKRTRQAAGKGRNGDEMSLLWV